MSEIMGEKRCKAIRKKAKHEQGFYVKFIKRAQIFYVHWLHGLFFLY